MENNKKISIGIDLGTTNSCIAFANIRGIDQLTSTVVEIPRQETPYSTGKMRLHMEKHPTLPSVVFYPEENNNTPIVGDFAKHQYALRPMRVAKSIKSQMGEEKAQGLAEDLPDKTPAEISARILEYIRKCAENFFRTDVKDAVITVPANFDTAMCKATLEAARIAGFETTYPDGSEKPMLLSEPNAVLYDLINQVSNGMIPDTILDLEEPKYVAVFDLGGGTLDITLHKVQFRDEKRLTVKVDEIATNRYTLLGGDDFDKALAEVMFNRFLQLKAPNGGSVLNRLQKQKNEVMPQLLVCAEKLKMTLGDRKNKDLPGNWYMGGMEEPLDAYAPLAIGVEYDDVFTEAEVEAVFEKFMGNGLVKDDYKRLASIKDSHNIIYPILEVMAKAEQKLGHEVKVDVVVLNGGMSKFYMVEDRLKEFFGFDPIKAVNPDQAVARGAAVYHYYLLQNEAAMKEDMRLLGDAVAREVEAKANSDAKVVAVASTPNRLYAAPKPQPFRAIEWGKTILNDALYLGVQNGAVVEELISTGQELPYESGLHDGFKIEAGHKDICLPIQARDTDGTIRTIVKGHINLSHPYPEDVYVSFKVFMSLSKVLTMKAWITKDYQGAVVLETATVNLEIGHSSVGDKGKKKLAAPLGSKLNASNEIQSLLRLCGEGVRTRRGVVLNTKAIRNALEQIKLCANKEDFARPILNALQKRLQLITQSRLVTLARQIGSNWNSLEKRELAEFCMNQLGGEISGFHATGQKVTLNMSCIMALGMCGNSSQLKQLSHIQNPKYTTSLVYVFGKLGVEQEWLWEKLQEDLELVKRGTSGHVAVTAYAFGSACRKDLHPELELPEADKAALALAEALNGSWLIGSDAVCLILAMAWLCDQRFGKSHVKAATLEVVKDAIAKAGAYSVAVSMETAKAKKIAEKLLEGQELSREENEYLLQLAEGYEQIA